MAELSHRPTVRVTPSRKLLGLPADAIEPADQSLDGTTGPHEALSKRWQLQGSDNIALFVVIVGCALALALWVLASLRLTVWLAEWLAG